MTRFHASGFNAAGQHLFLLVIFGVTSTASASNQNAAAVEKAKEGWYVHELRSEYQAAPTQVRVLVPDALDVNKKYRVLYVLPVEANSERRYGDGLAEVQRCNIHNKHNLICVAPSFAHLPWYADHPTEKSIRQESYFVKDVLGLVEKSYPVQAERQGRWLLGFSKSGWGAWSLLARHPDLFDRAAAWDAPLDMPRFDQYGAGPIFGTAEHFDTYRVLPAIRNCRPLQGTSTRLILTGFDNFRDQHQTAHQRLDEWKVPHVYRDGPRRKHVWDSGWVGEAVELLAALNTDET